MVHGGGHRSRGGEAGGHHHEVGGGHRHHHQAGSGGGGHRHQHQHHHHHHNRHHYDNRLEHHQYLLREQDNLQEYRYNTSPDTTTFSRKRPSAIGGIDSSTTSNGNCHPCKVCCQCCCMTVPVACCMSGPMLKRLKQFGFGSLPLVLFIIAIIYSISGMKTTWVLNPGEMRQLGINMFTEYVKLTCDDISSGCFRVYRFPNQNKCPPLTGPTFVSEDSSTMTLGVGDYQYDYFYLTQGSRITLSLQQTDGASNVYILNGPHVVDQLESYDLHFLQSVLRQVYVNADNDAHSTKTLHYTVKESTTYVLLYENAASYDVSNLSTHHLIEHTTYDLGGKVPYCEYGHGNCEIQTVGNDDNRGCIIVQANDEVTDAATKEDIAIDIVGQRNWGFILLVASIPLFLEWLWKIKVGASNSCKSCASSSASAGVPKLTNDGEYEAIGDNDNVVGTVAIIGDTAEEAQQRSPFTADLYPGDTEIFRPSSSSEPIQIAVEAGNAVPVNTMYDSIPTVPYENIVPIPPPSTAPYYRNSPDE